MVEGIHHFDTIDSTHTLALEWVSNLKPKPFTAIVADHQTNGRGRQSKYWLSAPGASLLMSVICYPQHLQASQLYRLHIASTSATLRLLHSYGMTSVQIKWPNDMLIEDRKIAGLLISNHLHSGYIRSSVISIGLNVHQQQWPDELLATSMADHRAIDDLSISSLAQTWLDLLQEVFVEMSESFDEMKSSWVQHLRGYDSNMLYETSSGERWSGRLCDVSDDGTLRIETNLGLMTFPMESIRQVIMS